jgi:hypothetical protein
MPLPTSNREGGALGPILRGKMRPQVSKEFGTLLANLAKKAEAG